ncbi:MAG TPA: hypothetical protein VIK28_08525, partial [Sedimentisphaerales bacterium]
SSQLLKRNSEFFAFRPNYPAMTSSGFAIDVQLKDPWHPKGASDAKASATRRKVVNSTNK